MISAIDLLFIQQINGKTFDQLKRYDFWLEDHGESNSLRLKRLINDEILVETDDIALSLSQFTIPTLKSILKAHDLRVSGNKNDLLQRLNQHKAILNLKHLTIKPVYTAHPRLHKLLNDTTFIAYLSMNGPLNFEDGYQYFLEHKNITNEDLIIDLYKDKIAQSNNPYLIIKCHLFLSDYYKKKHKSKDSLKHLNIFTMLLVLSAINRYTNSEHVLDSFFDLDQHTLDKYRHLLLMKQYSIEDLYELLLSDTRHLSTNKNHMLAAQYIIRSIIGSPYAEEKLLEQINR